MNPSKAFAALIAAGLLLFACWFWWSCERDPTVAFLPADRRAEWILYPKPPDTFPHHALPFEAVYRRSFDLPASPAQARLLVRAFRQGAVSVNGRSVPDLSLTGADWKRTRVCDITALLRPGTNEISVIVGNSMGPPALWLALETGTLLLRSDKEWQVSLAGAAWQSAAFAQDSPGIRPGNHLYGRERMSDSLRASLPAGLVLLVLSVALVFGMPWLAGKPSALPTKLARVLSPAGLLLLVLLLWVILFCNNLPQLPALVGFDRDGHLQYIDYLLQKKSLPLADAGWTMYQPPLFYLLSALLLGPFGVTASADGAVLALRIVSALTGLGHLALIFLCLRRLFPNRPGQQAVGLVLAGFVSANLCLSHHVTNEVMSAFFVTAALYFTLRLLPFGGVGAAEESCSASMTVHRPFRLQLVVGLCLGLALLTKFSALLAIPVILGAVVWVSLAPRKVSKEVPRLAAAARAAGVVAAATLVVCGWHYFRVWRHFGNPLIGNWDPRLPFAWWQDPGYHTANWYYRLGQAWVCPLFSSLHGLADGLYSSLWGDGLISGGARMGFRPPWNYDLMNLGFLLSLFPAGLVIVGAGVAFSRFIRRPGPTMFLVLFLVMAFTAGILLMTLRVPSYAQVKAFYALPALLSFTVLGVLGWEAVATGSAPRRRGAALGLAIWALVTYCSFWIRAGNPFTHTVLGVGLADDKRHVEALSQFRRALELDPRSLGARVDLVDTLTLSGQTNEAVAEAVLALEQHPEAPEALMQMGLVIARAGRYGEGIDYLRRSIARAPDNPNIYAPLAFCLAKINQHAEAVAAAEEGLRVNPVSPELHQRLATSLAGLGDFTNAAAHLEIALQLKPGWFEARSLLAFALLSCGRPAEAAHYFQQALEQKPEEPKLNYLYALTLASLGRISDAVNQYRVTLNYQPEMIEALNNLAWLLAASPDDRLRDGTEAVRLAEHACRLTQRREPVLLGTLAAAYAEAGRFPDAVATGEAAKKLALDSGQNELADKNQALLDLYRAGKTYRDPGAANR